MKNAGCGAAIIFAFVLAATSEMLSKESDLKWECDDGGKILLEWLCDDMNDCDDGSDENQSNCADKECEENLFRCNNTRCIDNSFVCNGEVDCLDGDASDEENCDYTRIPQSKEDCAHFLCTDHKECLLNQWVCDGERDCLDGSDEWNCTCEIGTYGCFVRGVPLCLKNTTRCNNVQHCDNGEDEFGCEYSKEESTFSCPPTYYKCQTEECVPWTLVCDGINDCRDKTDEGGLCHVKDCEKMSESKRTSKKCDQLCHDTPDGAMCSCTENYRLHKNGFACVDIDECAEMSSDLLHNAEKLLLLYKQGLRNVCSQTCINLPGGFRCDCVDGYSLDADGYTCKAKGFDPPNLYIAVGSDIRVISLRKPGDMSFSYKMFYENDDTHERISDIDVDSRKRIVFWIEENSGNLFAKISGKPSRRVFLPRRPIAIAYDWITTQIYVASFKRSNYGDDTGLISLLKLSIESDFDKINAQKPEYFIDLATEGLKRPSALAVCPSEGVLVVVDDGGLYTFEHAPTRILLVNMDGSNMRALVDDLPIIPTDVIVDDVKKSVIWSSGDLTTDLAKIESIKLDGTQRGTIVSRQRNRFPLQPVSIAVFEDHLLIADRESREVRSWQMTDVSLYSRQNSVYESNGVAKFPFAVKLRAIRMSHPVLQRPLEGKNNKCKNVSCSSACVNTPTEDGTSRDFDAKCLCPTNMFLADDRTTCELSNKIVHEEGKEKNFQLPPVKTNRVLTPPNRQINRIPQIKPVVTCPSMKPVKHATTSAKFFLRSVTRVGNSVVFKCMNNYEISEGSKQVKLTCMPNGKWSSPRPTCVPSPPTTPVPTSIEVIATTPSQNHVSTPVLLNKITKIAPVTKTCAEIKCGQFSECVMTSLGATCRCVNGGNVENCSLEPYSTNDNSVTTEAMKVDKSDSTDPASDTTVIANIIRQPATSVKSKLLGPLIAVVVILSLVLAGISWKYLHKRRLSVDLIYFRDRRHQDDASNNNRQDELVKEFPISSGNSTSITNPNYTSPTERKRLPKPSYRDNDSGYHRSAGSESISSNSISTSDSSTSCANEMGKASLSSSFLLDEDNGNDDEKITITNVVAEDSPFMTPSTSGFKRKVGSIFRMRKSESRECMLPKRKGKRKLEYCPGSVIP